MGSIQVLALIPDSTRKRNGSGQGAGGPSIMDLLPREAANRLVGLREKVASSARLPPAADMDPTERGRVELLPAYLRFDGNMYRRIPRKAWEGRKEGVEVAIVSALYGLVLSGEPIRAYDFSMAENLPGLGPLHTWWRENGLPSLLAALIKAAGPTRVVDLLSIEYRKAVQGYRDSLQVSVHTVDFPGLGRASQPRRGEFVAALLEGKS